MSGAANYSRLVFDYDPANPTLYEKIFCVNPPPDICPFGPCPNSDVTGIGQQVSIYITTVIYAIVLVYIPWLGRPMLYAHLSVIYSLLIAALISILKTSLTQNDGVFVLVSVASPATLYLWYLSIRSIWSPKWFPVDLPEKHKSTEFQILRVLTILSLAFTIALVCLMYVPSEKINFSQPACSQVFGRELWYNIAWQLPWVIQVASITVLFFFTLGVSWIWSLRRRYEVPPKSHLLSYMEPADFKADPYAINPPMRQNIDIVTWTESILHDVYPRFMNPTLSSSIVAIMQWNIVPAWIWVIPSKDTIAFFILAYGLFREPPKPHEPHPWMIWYIRMIVLVAAVAAVLICHKIQILSLVDWVFIFVVITSIIWSVKNFTYRNMKVFLPTILSLSIPIVFGAQVLTFVLGSSKAFSREAQENPLDIASTTMPFMISTVSMAWWLISWNATAFWPWKVYLRPKEFSKALTPRTHLLKFFFLVLGPHILWVQACIGSNPTGSTDMTFGQVAFYSLLSTTTVPLI
ncbi:hypothetical protein CC2G_012395 [Coprinopsis cinerea AmutBmut pab1-1]|nr:hypothetical protein CC2G_012395 [Coprinopsis cinerea AmutBmut pab1-1]